MSGRDTISVAATTTHSRTPKKMAFEIECIEMPP
jgi:hypothetical protein